MVKQISTQGRPSLLPQVPKLHKNPPRPEGCPAFWSNSALYCATRHGDVAGTSGAAQSADQKRKHEAVQDLQNLEGGSDLLVFWNAIKYGSNKLPAEVAAQTGSFFPLGRDASGHTFDEATLAKFQKELDKVAQRKASALFLPELLRSEKRQVQTGRWVKEWANAPLLAG
jgi:hypothetical protein